MGTPSTCDHFSATSSATRNVRTREPGGFYPTYVTSQWGRVYLDKVYVPVLARHSEGLYYQLVDAVQERVEKSMECLFGLWFVVQEPVGSYYNDPDVVSNTEESGCAN